MSSPSGVSPRIGSEFNGEPASVTVICFLGVIVTFSLGFCVDLACGAGGA
jgi:hypothetical protein